MKKVLSVLLATVMLLTALPLGAMSVSAVTLSQSEFDAKLSSAKATYPAGSQRQEWSIGGTVVGWQCHGYGRWLSWYVWGVDFANGSGTGWTLRKSSSSSSYINSLVPGDVVRFRRISAGVLKTWNHTIFITSIVGDTVYYTDCNSDGACTILWEQSVPKSTLDSWLKLPLYGSEAATYGYIAHYTPNTLTGGSVSCGCSSSYAGTYICTTSSLDLTIRSGHGSSYSAVGFIPPGATVTVSKASGTSSSDWAHVTYNGVSGYASMEYLRKKGTSHAETPTIRWWLSDSEYGEAVDNCKIGNRYYFCYRLYDSVTGKDWDEVSSDDYTVNIGIYNPDGSLNYQSTKSSDMGWISIFYTTTGTYIRKVVVDGDFLFEGSQEFYVASNPPKVHASTNAISLNLSGTKWQTIQVWSSGYYSGNAVLSWSSSNSRISCTWGEWTDDRLPLAIDANSAGTTTLTISLKDKDTGTVLDSINILVTINVNATTLSVNSMKNVLISTGGEMKYFTYTPTTSGKYVIYSKSGSGDTKAYLYDANWTELASDDDGGEGNNFRLEYNLMAGTKYVFGVKYYSSSTTGAFLSVFGHVYTVTYNANGGSGAPSPQDKDYETSITLSSTIPTRTGYTFLGWSTSPTAPIATYQPGDSYSYEANTTLYAVWKPNTYTVNYSSNGGSGAPAHQVKEHNVPLTLSSVVPTKPGYKFLGWATSADATTAQYAARGTYTTNADVILYAVWECNHTYDNACDSICNTCGASRATSGHTYSNACDAACNTCGAVRTPAAHVYDNDTDPTCNVCGAIREVEIPADAPAFAVDSVRAQYGNTFKVAVRTRNNPGIVGLRLRVQYDTDLLELVNAEVGTFTGTTFGPLTANPFTFTWADAIHPDNTSDDAIVWLTFRAKEGTDPTRTVISLSYDADDVYNDQWENVFFNTVSGMVDLTATEPGDLNADGKVNVRDLGLLQQHLNGWEVTLDETAADVTGDGKVNVRDLGLLQQYLNGWDVTLG